jgi:prophage tail gpP-like protein
MSQDGAPTRVIITGGTTEPPPSPAYQIPYRPVDSKYAKDQATLIVGGIDFQNWESVFVSATWHDSWSYFKFTSVERDPPPGNITLPQVASWFTSPQFLPGDTCIVNLGGIPVIMGFVEVRQVAYDAGRHGIEISGKSFSELTARSSVDTDTGSFDGMTWKNVADKVVEKHPTKVIPIGTLNETKFEKLQNQPGELIHDFLERIARPRGIILGNDSFGNFLAIGKHSMPVVNTQLIEGQNIKSCQCVIHKAHEYNAYITIAQGPGSDDKHGTAVSELRAEVQGRGMLGTRIIVPSEQTVSTYQEALDRSNNERIWREGDHIDITVTVQGWFRDDTNLWWPGENVFIYSPMCPVNQMMKIKTCVYTQDNNSGTQTTMTLLEPWALNDEAMNTQSKSAGDTSTPDPSLPSTGQTQTGRSPGPV